MSRDNDQKGKHSPEKELSRDNYYKRCAYIKQIATPKSFPKNKSLLPATSILSCPNMVYNTTLSLDKLT